MSAKSEWSVPQPPVCVACNSHHRGTTDEVNCLKATVVAERAAHIAAVEALKRENRDLLAVCEGMRLPAILMLRRLESEGSR